MTRGRDDQRRVDSVGIHARLVVMMHRDQRPVRHDTRDPHPVLTRPRNQIFDTSRVEQLDVRHLQHLRHHRRGEERSVLDDHVGALVFIGDTDLAEEGVGGLAHDHGGEELTTEPGATAGRDGGFNDSDTEVGTLRGEDVGGAEAAGAGADDDNVGLGVIIEIL